MSIPGRQENDFWNEFERLAPRISINHDGSRWNAEWETEFDRKKREAEEKERDDNGSV